MSGNGTRGGQDRDAHRRHDPGQRRRPRHRAPGDVRRAAAGQVPGHGAQAHPPDGRDRRLGLRRQRDPQRRPQRRGGPAARGVRHRAHVARRHASRLLRRPRAGARHVGQRRARLHVLPVLPPVLRPALRPPRGQGRGARHGAGLQRLAHRQVVRRRAGPLHPAVHPRHLGPRARGRGGAPGGQEGLPRRHLLREPREARLALAAQRATGTPSGRPAPTRAPSCACTWARPRRS